MEIDVLSLRRSTLLLACAACLFIVSSAAGQAGDVARVSNSAELLAALQTPAVQTIVLLKDVAMDQRDFDKYEGSPLPITRNVTVMGPGPAGPATNPDTLPMIDLMHMRGALELCSRCTFRFLFVNIAHENVVGTGLGMSMFRGLTGSRVERLGGVGLRLACPPTRPTLIVLNSTQRTQLFPGGGGQQLAGATDYVFRGKTYVDMLKIYDLSADIAPLLLDKSIFIGGYAIRRRNATRLCEYIVPPQCLQQNTPEECIAELMARERAGGGAAMAMHTAAIVAPVVVGGVLLLAAVVAQVLWRRHRRRPLLLHKPGLEPGGAAAAAAGSDAEAGSGAWRLATPLGSAASQRQPGSADTEGLVQSPATGDHIPWQPLWCSSAPSMAWAANNTIELGVLLGAGSFARVYKARWSGLDVAVKVIQHHRSSARDVANEVQLMLNLNHPHIVRAYHALTQQLVSAEHGDGDDVLQQQQQQQQQLAGTAPSSARSSAAPGSADATVSSSAAPLGGTASGQQQQQLAPAGPGQGSGAAAPGAGGASGNLSTSETGPFWQHVQDLDPAAPPHRQRQQQPQQPQPPGSLAVTGAAAAAGPAAGSAAAGALRSHGSAASQAPASSAGAAGAGAAGTASLFPAAAAASSSGSGVVSSAGSSAASSHHRQAWAVIDSTRSTLGPAGPATTGTAGSTVFPSAAAALPGDGEGGGGGSGSDSGDELHPTGAAGLCETWLVTELCDRGTLARQAADLQPQAVESDMLGLLLLLRDVARGLRMLHSLNIVHADLNAHNVLVTSSLVAQHGLVAKIADLGLSRVLKQHATHRTTRTCGMLTHQPPELLQDGRTSPAVDIYSFGIMMHEVFTRQSAYARLRYGQIYHQVVVLGARPPVPPDMPEDYELLMQRCWSTAAAQRPSVDTLLECLDLMIRDRQAPPHTEPESA